MRLLTSGSAILTPVATAQTVGPPVIFTHGICEHPSAWASVSTPVINYLSNNQPSLYPNPNIFVAVATGPYPSDVRFYDSSGNRITTKPLDQRLLDARFFSIAFVDPKMPLSSPQSFDVVSVMGTSIKDKGDELATVIAAIKQIVLVPKVILVAHSMGGLDARSYLENLGTVMSHKPGNDADVIELTTIDTPHTGSPLTEISSNAGIFSAITDLLLGACIGQYSEDISELEPSSPTIGDLNYQTSAAGDIPSTITFDSMVNYVPDACQGLFPKFPYCYEEPDYVLHRTPLGTQILPLLTSRLQPHPSLAPALQGRRRFTISAVWVFSRALRLRSRST